MSDLFSDAAEQRLPAVAPLALRMRPQSLEEFVGQQHVLGPGSALRLAIEEDRVRSAIFYGPPGTGKTTLARIVARATGAEFEELSAVSATVAQVRGVLAGARERLGATGRRTILFLDEIHRFNKAQQDALLPGVEEGVITLIGATTENPYMEVNSALLSRAQVYELESLSIEDLETVARRGAAELGVEIPDDLLRLIATRAGGDARSVHNIVELAVQTAQAAGEPLAEAHVDDAARKRPLVYDKAADAHYDFISAFIKSMRGSDPDASVYYLAAMLESGEDARYIARRMIVLASEDIGNADPRALMVAVAAAQAVEHVGLPEARLNLSQAAIYLALAPKSNASYEAIKRATTGRPGAREHPAAEVPARRQLLRAKARTRRGLRVPALRSGRLRGRLSPGRAQGNDVLRAVRQRRGVDGLGLVGAAADPLRRERAEVAADAFPGLRGTLDVVLDPAEHELTVVTAQCVRSPHVTVERHAGAAGIDQRRAVRPRPPKLQMAVTEDDGAVADAVQHPLVVVTGLRREALDVGERRAVDIENAVQVLRGLK